VEFMLSREDGTLVSQRCVLADDPFKRAKGLLGRSSLESDEGLFVAASSIHTLFMRFPIDAVFLDGEMRIVRIIRGLRPWRFATCRDAHSVVALPAGESARLELSLGQRMRFTQGTVRISSVTPPRVVVVTRDRRFRRVAQYLLGRHGFRTEVSRNADAAVELAERDGADVVLIDGSESLLAAARALRRLSERDPAVTVIVVSDGEDEAPQTLPVLPKWGAFDAIVDAIESGVGVARG
jgi:uncharacterized membrane protein (UPF0127 family)/CheY-like chemotaxis protein